jgi:ABC-2 type transport system permease protein
MNKILYVLKKEFLIIGRDVASLLLLFLMPAIFILVMSLAMSELFATHSKVQLHVLVLNQDQGSKSKAFMENMEKAGNLVMHPVAADMSVASIQEKMLAEDYKFTMIVRDIFTPVMESKNVKENRKPVLLLVNPTVNTHTQMIFKNVVSANMGKLRFAAFIDNIAPLLDMAKVNRKAIKNNLMAPEDDSLVVEYVYKDKKDLIIPSAVQQSVPAWLVFAMFFISMPLSNTFITERNQGTLMRMMSMNISRAYLLFGKFLPYFLINLTQVLLMILVGMYVVPLVGGQALTPGNSPEGLLLISACVSFSAVSMALLISVAAKTTDQATTISGVTHIILGAIGGIMVPKFVMPGVMQKIADLSPMSWGMEGFLDIFLRHGGVRDVLPECMSLLVFGAIMLMMTVIIMNRKFERGGSL